MEESHPSTSAHGHANNQMHCKSATTPAPRRHAGSTRMSSGIDWRNSLQNANVLTKLEYLLENEIYTDTIFVIGESKEVVKCHSLLLKMHSKDFENMLNKDKHEHEITSCTPAAFRRVIKYLYTDQLDVNAVDAMETLILAKRFHLTTLQRKCGQIILKGITSSNAAFLFNNAEAIGDKELAMKSQEYMIQHADEVFLTDGFAEMSIASLEKVLKIDRSLWNVDEVTLFEAVKKWAMFECTRQNRMNCGPNLYAVAQGALDFVKFEKFTPIQFTSHVVKSNILPSDLMLKIQSDLIEKESMADGHEAHIHAKKNGSDSLVSHNQEGVVHIEDDRLESENHGSEIKHVLLHALIRYTGPVMKDWGEKSGLYKISFAASRTVNLVGVALYGHGNGSAILVDIDLKITTFDEQSFVLCQNTSTALPTEGGEFDVMFDTPVNLRRSEWYTIIILMNGRIFPYGTGGKRNYVVPCGSDTVEFSFKNSREVSGASHMRGQLPKLYFSLNGSVA